MGSIRGWDVAVASAAAILVALVVANGAEGAELVGAVAVIAAIVLVWVTLGRSATEGSPRAITVSALIIVLSGVGTAISPSMATVQAIAFPLMWVLQRTTRQAVVANVLLAVSVGAGYFFGLGPSWSLLYQALVIETISLAGSFAIGFWITRISEESAERARLIDELRQTQEQLELVSRDAGALGERERLAREIHDTIAQDLAGLVLLAQRTRRELGTGDPTVGETVDLLEDSARKALQETRSLVATTAPVGLTEAGIRPALDRLAERFTRETGVDVTVDGQTGALDRDTEVVLLRCAQEGLANVRKHSGARTARLDLSATDTTVTLVVDDDGAGFDQSLPTTGFGLVGMRDRLALVGGTLEITSSAGAGARLAASLPLAGGATA